MESFQQISVLLETLVRCKIKHSIKQELAKFFYIEIIRNTFSIGHINHDMYLSINKTFF